MVVEAEIIDLDATLRALARLGSGKVVHQNLPSGVHQKLLLALTN